MHQRGFYALVHGPSFHGGTRADLRLVDAAHEATLSARAHPSASKTPIRSEISVHPSPHHSFASRRSRPSRLCIAPWHPFPPICARSPTRCAPITRSPLAPLPRPPALLSIEAGWATHSTEDPRPLRLVRRLHDEAEVCTKPTNKERPPVLLTKGRQIPRCLPSSSTDAG